MGSFIYTKYQIIRSIQCHHILVNSIENNHAMHTLIMNIFPKKKQSLLAQSQQIFKNRAKLIISYINHTNTNTTTQIETQHTQITQIQALSTQIENQHTHLHITQIRPTNLSRSKTDIPQDAKMLFSNLKSCKLVKSYNHA